MGSRTHAVLASKQLSKKAPVSHVCKAVDREKCIGPMRQKMHILKPERGWAAKVGQTSQIDNDDVEARFESLQCPASANEGTNMPSVCLFAAEQ